MKTRVKINNKHLYCDKENERKKQVVHNPISIFFCKIVVQESKEN